LSVVCQICPHHCNLSPGQTGICKARKNIDGAIVCINYGKITAIALDPIEKKPLRHFHPGSKVLSIGSFGCNMRCNFCQNHSISAAGEGLLNYREYSPAQLSQMAKELECKGNIGLAYTYNEPFVGYEFVFDCAKHIKDAKLKNVVVTNGLICEETFKDILPLIDAMNIDLKCFNHSYYKKLGGDFDTVKKTIENAVGSCHLEITNLIVPGENDSVDEMEELASWLASLNKKIPLHISRFFPNYKLNDRGATPISTLESLYRVAKNHLDYVYLGNV